MKKFIIIALVALSACGRFGDNYQPHLQAQPKSQLKYEADRKGCIADARLRQENAKPSGANVAALGGLGMVLDGAVNDQNDDYHKTPMQMTDECMTAKGYKVVAK